MELLKLNNEYYLIGDAELEIKGRDSYYYNGNVTESAGGEQEKGDYRDCRKVLAATVQLRDLPLIDKNEIEKIFRDSIVQAGIDTFTKMSNIPDSRDEDTVNALRGQFVSGFVNGYITNQNENKQNFTPDEMILFCQECLVLANSNEIGRVSKFIHERLESFIRKPKTEWWYRISVDGVTFPFHSKKWGKMLGRVKPSVNEKGYITIKSIYKK
jgi:hypothetical protein